MTTPLAPSQLVHSPLQPPKTRLWQWRALALMGLLILLWLYVLPYQAGVRLDQSLNNWVSNHPNWALERGERSLFQRQYQLKWQSALAIEPMLFDVRVYSKPFGWPTPAGRQDGWATFLVRVAHNSPVQIKYWPDHPIQVTGRVGGLGLVQFNGTGGHKAESNRITYDQSRHTWQGMLNLLGWQIHTPTHRYLFGRTLVDLHLYRKSVASPPYWQAYEGELGVDIRRMGWQPVVSTESSANAAIGPANSGLIDQLRWRIRSMPDYSGLRQDVIGSAAIDALQVGGQPLGGGQLAFAIYSADPDFTSRLAALWQQIGRNLATSAPALSTFALPPVLSTLRSAEIRLDTLRWQTSTGAMAISGKAFGPQFIGDDALNEDNEHNPRLAPPSAHGHWQAQAQIQLSGGTTRAPVIESAIDWLNSWLPRPLSKEKRSDGAPVHLVLTYSPVGWFMEQKDPDARKP